MSLVSCLPALEDFGLGLPERLLLRFLGYLLEALASCPRLKALNLHVNVGGHSVGSYDGGDEAGRSPDLSAFAKLRSLTKLVLFLGNAEPYSLADVVGALVSLTGLAELELAVSKSSAVPAALGRLKGLRSLGLFNIRPCVLEEGCLDLPNLLSLEFACCSIMHAEVLPGVTALQNLTSITFSSCQGPHCFDHQLVQLPRLQRIIFDSGVGRGECLACPWLTRLPADMGSLTSSLLRLDCTGVGLAQSPLALMQLVALKHLDASFNDFAELPAAITGLSRLTELAFGRVPGRAAFLGRVLGPCGVYISGF